MGDGVLGAVSVSRRLSEIGINHRPPALIKPNLSLKEENITSIATNNIECIKSLGIHNPPFLIKLIYAMHYLLKYELKFNDTPLKYTTGETFNNC